MSEHSSGQTTTEGPQLSLFDEAAASGSDTPPDECPSSRDLRRDKAHPALSLDPEDAGLFDTSNSEQLAVRDRLNQWVARGAIGSARREMARQ